MKKDFNPLSFIVIALVLVGAIILAFAVRSVLPESIERFGGLIFWGIVAGAGGLGCFIFGRLTRRND